MYDRDPVVWEAGDTKEVKLIVNSGPGFAGKRIWYLSVRDTSGNKPGWQSAASYRLD